MICLAVQHTHTHHTYAQALDESDSVSNEGISVYNKHGKDPGNSVEEANIMSIHAIHTHIV